MKNVNLWRPKGPVEHAVPAPRDFVQITNVLCDRALDDAKGQLHPLLRDARLERLEERPEFLQTFKRALEQRIARKLATWDPGVQAVFQFDETRMETPENWDGSIHLLVKVPHLSEALKVLGRRLDRCLVKYFQGLDWSRFQARQSILEVQQVTLNELRHVTGYGAMFAAVYTAPVKVWPQERKRSR